MIKGIKKLALIGLILAGCAGNSKTQLTKFEERAYSYLVDNFKDKGLYSGNFPLFDFQDKEVRGVYEKNKECPPWIIQRDEEAREAIKEKVEEHFEKYENRNLVLISGAAFHIYGVVEDLEDSFGGEYVSTTPRRLDMKGVIESNLIFRYFGEKELEKARETLELQVKRANGVVRGYGYDDLEDFMTEISDFKNSQNIFLGIEETGLHNLYYSRMGKVYEILGSFLEKYCPRSVLYLREEAYFKPDQDRELFLKKARKLGIPVEIKGY